MSKEIDDDERSEKLALYMHALRTLAGKQQCWKSNAHVFALWDYKRRLQFITHIEIMATKKLPMALQLIAKVIELRLTGK